MFFLGFLDIAPRKPFVILLHCSDNAQTYRIAGHVNLEGGRTEIEASSRIVSRSDGGGRPYVLYPYSEPSRAEKGPPP